MLNGAKREWPNFGILSSGSKTFDSIVSWLFFTTSSIICFSLGSLDVVGDSEDCADFASFALGIGLHGLKCMK